MMNEWCLFSSVIPFMHAYWLFAMLTFTLKMVSGIKHVFVLTCLINEVAGPVICAVDGF